jgi:hypothetical protein
VAGERREPQGAVSPEHINDYIHDMVGELAELASAHGQLRLAAILRAALEEARESSRSSGLHPGLGGD